MAQINAQNQSCQPGFEKLHCDDYQFTCKISKQITNYLYSSNILYCATLSRKFIPHITPVVYAYEMNKCSISFLIGKNSKLIRNLRRNPFLSLTTDIMDKKNPSLTTGLLIHAVAYFNANKEEILQNLFQIKKRYTKFNIPELVSKYLESITSLTIQESHLLVNAKIISVIYWSGAVIIKDWSLKCPARKFLSKQNPNFPPELMV